MSTQLVTARMRKCSRKTITMWLWFLLLHSFSGLLWEDEIPFERRYRSQCQTPNHIFMYLEFMTVKLENCCAKSA